MEKVKAFNQKPKMKLYSANTRIVAGCLAALTALIILPGCGQKKNCSGEKPHAQIYITNEGKFIEYVPITGDEFEYYHVANWTEDYVPLTDEIIDMDYFSILSIEKNKTILEETMLQNQNLPHTEYQYKCGFFTDSKAWTTDYTQDDLTGLARDITYKYKGCKIITNDKGKKTLVESPWVDNIFEISKEYPYFNNYLYCKKDPGIPYFLSKNKEKVYAKQKNQ